MNNYITILKKEFKDTFNIFSITTKKISKFIISLAFYSLIYCVFIFVISKIIETYLNINEYGVFNVHQRGLEMFNVMIYITLGFLVVNGLEKCRRALIIDKDKNIINPLPIKKTTVTLAKVTIIYLEQLIIHFTFMLPIVIVFYVKMDLNAMFILNNIIINLLIPFFAQLIIAVLLIPYTLLINNLKIRIKETIIILVLCVGFFFFLYMKFISVLQKLLETGNIKYIFNENTLNFFKNVYKYSYPVKYFSNIALQENILLSWIFIISLVTISIFISILIYKYVLLNISSKYQSKYIVTKAKVNKEKNQFNALLKKEFITVFREPIYMFSYIVIAFTMPIMVYFCFTLFEQLFYNIIAINIKYEIFALILNVFMVLMNTFCATNISREKESIFVLKSKPLKPALILDTKIIFCLLINLISLILTLIIVHNKVQMNILQSLFTFILSAIFNLSLILISTKIDLKNAKVTKTKEEGKTHSDLTIAKTNTIGMSFSLILGIIIIIIPSIFGKEFVWVVYLIEFIFTMLLLAISILYYRKKTNFYFNNISM